ncbi:LOW QUALITY PROTEIN: hypothetical protein OSB04_025339 [Centaurea solstitialis]|uniref:Leucine-rich repeat-containing N-terminal plant-type domain-containing protein n=1 Tax=Centaurea solstitialis TaxID=347529 RepID=A0AA38W1M0_9ASTR|nr:LOW QUALITY PROTEIN: hypothetical protein OSB04_025339 [Centaurea solstitialis]
MAPSCFQYSTFLPKLFLFKLLLLTCTQSLLTHDDECMALYLFKQSFPRPPFEAPGFQKFDSWKITSNASNDDGSDCCLWDGVACSDEEDHVIGLDLSGRYLRGHIKSNNTLFNLVHLQMLSLAMNDFTESQIPSQISRLKQLRTLNLSESGLSGQIPTEISHLIRLSSLDLSGNSLKLQSPSLEKLVQNLTRLEELHLSEVEISSSVPHFLANFSSLRSIKVRYCLLQNEFPMAIFQLPKLKVLDVAFNTNLTGFLPEFQNHSLLDYLSLGSTGFSGGIPISIENLHRLTALSLGKCYFSGIIPGSLANMTQLTTLDLVGVGNQNNGKQHKTIHLSKNNFTSTFLSLTGLTDWLSKLTNLNELHLSQMNLSGEIPTFFANLTKLSIVTMGRNSLSGRIPSSFMNLTRLSMIDLGQNCLQGTISSSFSSFKSLRILSLESNNFSGRVEVDWFLGLDKLEDLILGGNKISFVASTKNYTNDTLPELRAVDLSSCSLKEYPAFLRFQQKLRILFLNRNQIHGLIPDWGWNNSRETLEMINLSKNFITGFHQHQHFPSWTRLKYFDIGDNLLQGRLPVPPRTTEVYVVENNHLEGEISPLICQVKSLQCLYLSSNNITGILPPCFGSLSNSLFELDLSENKLQGTMMNSFKQGNPLKILDLSENQFVGQVSRSLKNCTNLEILSLGYNSFQDVFPFWLGPLVELQVLILKFNNFYGVVQGMTTGNPQFPKLRIIDLSNNGFSGQFPDKYLQSWKAMKFIDDGKSLYMYSEVPIEDLTMVLSYTMTITYKGSKTNFDRILNLLVAIDLSCNKFEEKSSIVTGSSRLQSLNLSHNHFTGHVLSSLENLKYLESLDLSRNKLSGEIPQQLLQLDFLAILNVSFNHLNTSRHTLIHLTTTPNRESWTVWKTFIQGMPKLKGVITFTNKHMSMSESFLPRERVDWIWVGNWDCFWELSICKVQRLVIERLGMTKDKWVRPLSNRRRNQAL